MKNQRVYDLATTDKLIGSLALTLIGTRHIKRYINEMTSKLILYLFCILSFYKIIDVLVLTVRLFLNRKMALKQNTIAFLLGF